MFKKFFICFITASFVFINAVAASSTLNAPEVVAQTAILIDQKDGKILFTKNEHERIFPASTTKILTALVAMEYLEMDALYEVGREINDIPLDSSKAGHKVGESILGINLIRGLIIPSGNETACVVALQAAKIASGNPDMNYAQAEQYFSELMNNKAKGLGATGTHFINPHGYHDDGHYTTAYDMGLISKAALDDPVIREIIKEKTFAGNGAGDKNAEGLLTQEYVWNSHNLLLNSDEYSYPYANGIKTGFTNEAGDSVAASAEKDGKLFIAVIFNSEEPNRWIDAKNLFEFGFNNYNYETLVNKSDVVTSVALDKPLLGGPQDLNLLSSEGFAALLSGKEKGQIEVEVTLDPEYLEGGTDLKTPVEQGTEVGKAVYKLGGEELFSTGLVTEKEAARRTIMTDINYYLNMVKENAFTLKAVPFWAGGAVLISLIVFIISKIKKGRRRNGYI
ncbi:MAG: D-alanyl-D-alanine carboxypeptidase [Clostridiales bacterium]|jgi:D-alanyl-D-alanine carboxypeptidase (penicillin-binding protein 5/6)|nr:D-alanyl-D-alanine carboxypeptidase [Clostridiales bacterium]